MAGKKETKTGSQKSKTQAPKPTTQTPIPSSKSPNVSVLFMAVMAGDMDSAKKAIIAGENVNQKDEERGVTPLILAVTRGDKSMVEFLLSIGADPNLGFKQKITDEDKEMLRSLQQMGKDDPEWKPQGDTLANIEAILSGKITEVDVTPLGIAIRKRNEELIAILKKAGAK